MRHSPHPTATEINERKKKSTKNLVFLKFVFVYNFINKKKTLTNFEVMFVKIKEKNRFFSFLYNTDDEKKGRRQEQYLPRPKWISIHFVVHKLFFTLFIIANYIKN